MVARLRTLPNGSIDKRQFNGGHLKPGRVNCGMGKPPGAVRKQKRIDREFAAQQHLKAGGLMPVDFMLSVLRDKRIRTGSGKNTFKHDVTWEDKQWAAEKLLHCFTPTLSAHKLDAQMKIYSLPPGVLEKCTDKELEVLEVVLKRLQGREESESRMIEGTTGDMTNEYALELAREKE